VRPRAPAAAEPSMSQTAIIIGARTAGSTPNGGRASAPTAPAPNAINRRRQSQARMTLWASARKLLARRGSITSVCDNCIVPGARSGKARASPSGGIMR